MLSYNEDAPRQEEINFRSFPAHSRLPVPAGSHVGACPAAPGAPQQGDCACKPSQLGALDESIVPAVQRSKASLGHSPGSTGDTACAGSPYPLLPLLLTPPWGQGELQALLWLCPKQNNFIGQGSLVHALEQEQGAGEQAPMELERGAGMWLAKICGLWGFPVFSFSNQVPSSFPVWQPLSLE